MVGVGEMIASSAVKIVFSRLTQSVIDEIALQWGYKDEVVKMVQKMKVLEAVMHDADDKLRRGGAIGKSAGLWLAKLKSVAYDIEDVLDDLDAPDSQPKCHNIIHRVTGPHKLDNMRKKIDELERESRTLNLAAIALEALSEGSRNNETFAATHETGMVGRDTERDNIINLLMYSQADVDISIIPIIGLGGVGKTTLAESVYTDERVKVFFHIKAWVYVSKEFDLQKIGSTIMRSLDSNFNLENCALQLIHDNLERGLATTRYLIVLDDLWEEDGDKLEELKSMLQYGSKGSRIIVTTRNLSVVEKLCVGNLANERKICPVSRSSQIKLDILEPEYCWEVMKQKALGPHDHGRSDLEEIGIQIAGNCGGLPLVLNALGQVMSESKNVRKWKNIRDTKVDLGLEDDYQKKILECLMPSYYYMKLEFKMCFTYLAAFPKGFIMNTDHLIHQWNALGYIDTWYNGQTCIDYLLGMSFLQISGAGLVSPDLMHAEAPREVTLHDLVHELASVITTNEFLVLDGDATKPRNWRRAIHCRHAQLIKYKKQTSGFKDLPGKLRSLHFRNSQELQLPKKAFSRSKYLRILDLSAHQKTVGSIRLPSSINKLKLLRYLDVSGLPITSLPKKFPQLRNMQILIMSNCSLNTLPDNIGCLHKLCYLDLSGNITLSKLPMSLGKLSELYSLNLLGCSLLQELPESINELTCLEILDMSKCCAIQKLPDKFGSLPNLLFLNLSDCSNLTELPDIVSLKFLEYLNLSGCHELENLPQNFGNLQNLKLLNLSNCYKVSVLPESFCKLIHLKDLNLSDCHELIELPNSFGNLSELDSLNLTSCSKLQLLPESLCDMLKLRHLNLSYCVSLEKLPSALGNLKLHILDISCAATLTCLPDGIDTMTSLNQFKVVAGNPTLWEMAEAIKMNLNLPGRTRHIVQPVESERSSNIVELEQLTCHELEIVKLQDVKDPEEAARAKLCDKSDLRLLSLNWGYIEEDIPVIGEVAFLSSFIQLDWRPKLVEDKSVLERLIPPRSLEQFILQGYLSKDFPNWMWDISSYLPSLTIIGLCGLGECDTLPPFGGLPNLRSIFLGASPKIRKIGREFYGDGGICTKLRTINLSTMENLEEWWTTQSGTENEEFLIPNLHDLTLTACPKLKFLPYPPRSIIWELDNSDESFPEGGFGEIPSFVVPFQVAIKNSNFSLNKWHGLQHFSTLVILIVQSCSSLRAFPEVMQCLTSLKSLRLITLEELGALPECLGCLTSLRETFITDCPNLSSLPESMKNLTAMTTLCLKGCKGLEILPEGIGKLISLQKFEISVCPNLTSFPESMKTLTALKVFIVESCCSLRVLPQRLGCLTSLKEFFITDCPNLTSLPQSMKNLTALRSLSLKGCEGLEILPQGIGQLVSLQGFDISGCSYLTSFPESMKNLSALKMIIIESCISLRVLPEWLGHLTSLEEIYIQDCPMVTLLPESMKNLTSLRKFGIGSGICLRVLPEWFGYLTSLEEIHIGFCPTVTFLPESMKNLTALRQLWLGGFNAMYLLPEWLGQLTSLEELSIVNCPNLASLPEGIRNLAALKKLHIENCPILVERCQGEDAHKISHIPEITLPDAEEAFALSMMSLLSGLAELGSIFGDAGASTSGDAMGGNY